LINLQFLPHYTGSPMTPTMPADGKATQAANSFQTRLSEAVSEAVAKRNANPKPSTAPALQPIPASQKTGAVRQSSVARAVNTTAAATLVTPFTPSGGSSATSPPAAASNAIMQPADIIANLLQQNPAPTPYAPTWQPSTNAAEFMSDDYDKQGNLSLVMREINHENGLRSFLYQNGLQNWAIGGMQGPPPTPPHYETLDLNAFNNWWDNLNASIAAGTGGQAGPTSDYVSNTIPDAGYL
jgi:hypothetical protein